MVLQACTIFGGKAADEPPHTIVVRDGDFQVRAYDTYVVARTSVRGAFDEAIRVGFRRLFRYISGDNRAAAKIEMTAPVTTAPDGEEIAMTAPVFAEPSTGADAGLSGRSQRSWTVRFVLPEGYGVDTAPQPTDPTVTLEEVAGRQVAVVRFSGFFDNRAGETNRRRLERWLAGRGQDHAGDWRMAGYNPPWTLPPLRRNEVLVTLR